VPEKQTLARARVDKRQGKAASTQAGEFIKEEMDHIREGVHGARSTKQAIAIGLSKARRAGVDLPPPPSGKVSASTRKRASRDVALGRRMSSVSRSTIKRSRASLNALKHEGTEAASPTALARQARSAARKRSPSERSTAAQQGSRTKGAAVRSAAAAKAARTRSSHRSEER
jgi:hypothetical protein